MVAFLPGDVDDLSESVFSAAFATILGLNISAWIFSAQTGLDDASYQDLVIMSFNTILAAPVLVSLLNVYDTREFRNSRETRRSQPHPNVSSVNDTSVHLLGEDGTPNETNIGDTTVDNGNNNVGGDSSLCNCCNKGQSCSCICLKRPIGRTVKKRYIMYYLVFTVILSVSTLFHVIIFLSRPLGIVNGDRTFIQISEQEWGSCKAFTITAIMISSFSLVQITALGVPVAVILWLWLTKSGFRVTDGISPVVKMKRWISLMVYFGSIAEIVLLEILTQDTISVVWDDGGDPWGFGQILAMVLIVAPLLALGDYALNPSSKLNGARPISARYLKWRNFCCLIVLTLILSGSLYFIANVRMWPIFWWLVIFVVPSKFFVWIMVALTGWFTLAMVVWTWLYTLAVLPFFYFPDYSAMFRTEATNLERYKIAIRVMLKSNFDIPPLAPPRRRESKFRKGRLRSRHRAHSCFSFEEVPATSMCSNGAGNSWTGDGVRSWYFQLSYLGHKACYAQCSRGVISRLYCVILESAGQIHSGYSDSTCRYRSSLGERNNL